jgi:nucleotide-binding universal stress UspA family protein
MASEPDAVVLRGEIVCVAIENDQVDAVASVAADLSRCLGQPLALVDVQVPVPPVATTYPPVAPAPPLEAETREPPRPVPRDLEALARRAGGSAVRYETRVGNPADVLVAIAGDPETSLVVAPDDGSGAFATLLGANPARRVLRDVESPVVLVPPESGGITEPLTIVAAISGDGAIEEVVGLAAALVSHVPGRLVLVHGWTSEYDEDALERARAALPADTAVELRAHQADAADAVESVAAEVDAGLIVLGPPAHGPLVSALLGSTTHAVASHAHVPVVVAPDEQRCRSGHASGD